MLRRLSLVVLFSAFGSVHADAFDFGISKDTAYLLYLTQMESMGFQGADLGLGLFYNDDSDYVATAEMMVVGAGVEEREDLEFGVGVKGYLGALDEPDENVYALALGAHARYVLPSSTPMGIVLEGFHAPDITSFGGTESVSEVSLRYEIQVVPNTLGYVGYRKIEAGLDGHSDVELDDNVNMGIRLIF